VRLAGGLRERNHGYMSSAMTIAATLPLREDGLTRTTLRIAKGLAPAQVAQVVHALQRTPGVLTVDMDAEAGQAIIAHDAAVPAAWLVTAAGAGAGVASAARPLVLAAPSAVAPVQTQNRRLLLTGLAALVALVLIDLALPIAPDQRWLFVAPVVVFWAVVLLRASSGRRS
jgi:hypothetical protein